MSYYGYDALSNVTFLANSAGTVTDTYQYDAFGNIVATSGTTPNSRLYRGEELDRDLGLINLRARQYNPASGRFFTSDPLTGSARGSWSRHRYAFGSADPVNRSDPWGLADAAEGGVGIAGVAGALVKATVIVSSAQVIGSGLGELARKNRCNINEGEDVVAALLHISMTNFGCPEYICKCHCPVLLDPLVSKEDLKPSILGPPLVPTPPKWTMTGVGVGLTEQSAKVRCIDNAYENIFWSEWNQQNDYFTNKNKCWIEQCTLR